MFAQTFSRVDYTRPDKISYCYFDVGGRAYSRCHKPHWGERGGTEGGCLSGVFACKRGGELRRWKSNGNGAAAMIIDPCQVPTVAAKAFIGKRRGRGRRGGSSTKREKFRLRRYLREWQEGGGSWARKGRRVNRWRTRKQEARGTLLNFRHPWRTNSEGRRAGEQLKAPSTRASRSLLCLPTFVLFSISPHIFLPLPGLPSASI